MFHFTCEICHIIFIKIHSVYSYRSIQDQIKAVIVSVFWSKLNFEWYFLYNEQNAVCSGTWGVWTPPNGENREKLSEVQVHDHC